MSDKTVEEERNPPGKSARMVLRGIIREIYFKYFRRFRVVRALKYGVDVGLWKGRIAWYNFLGGTTFAALPAKIRSLVRLVWRPLLLPQDALGDAEVLGVNLSIHSPSCTILNALHVPPDMVRSTMLAVEPSRRKIFTSAVVFGATDTLLCDNKLIYLLAADLSRHMLPEQQNDFFNIDDQKSRALLLKEPTLSDVPQIGEALSLLGGTTCNYVHWLTEYLPKLLMFEDISDSPIPVLIDEALPHNLKESIVSLARYPHKLIPVGKHQPYRVAKLHVIETGGFVPYNYLNHQVPDIRDDETSFSSLAIKALRTQSAERVLAKSALGDDCSPKLLVLRQSPYRRVINQNEVAEIATRYGYQSIIPEQHSFDEQVRIFASATHILGQTGAGIGNFLFSPGGCEITLFAANMHLGNYRYFHNMASLCGHNLSFIEGQPSRGSSFIHHLAHVDFEVDLDCLEQLLERQAALEGGEQKACPAI